MVFDAIYDTFAKIVDSKMKDKNVDDETFLNMVLKEMAKALTVAIYRNGTIEDVHAGEGFGAKDFKGIPDSCMKEINKDVCNKCYTMLKLLLSDEKMDCKRALSVLLFSYLSATEWDEPVLDNSVYLDEPVL